MFKKITIFMLLTTVLVNTSHAAQWTLFHCDHWAGSPNQHYQSWTTMFRSDDTVSLNNAIQACQGNQGAITVTSGGND